MFLRESLLAESAHPLLTAQRMRTRSGYVSGLCVNQALAKHIHQE